MKDVLALVKKIRKKSEIPIVLFGYYNPILSYGLKKFAHDVKASGADGTLVVDLPPEEAGDLKKEFDMASLDLIFLLTPTSNDDRMRLVASRASGFVYFVSVTGVTGARAALSKDLSGHVKKARRFTNIPIAVGFGISTPEQAKSVAAISDGVVVGSAIINRLARARTKASSRTRTLCKKPQAGDAGCLRPEGFLRETFYKSFSQTPSKFSMLPDSPHQATVIITNPKEPLIN